MRLTENLTKQIYFRRKLKSLLSLVKSLLEELFLNRSLACKLTIKLIFENFLCNTKSCFSVSFFPLSETSTSATTNVTHSKSKVALTLQFVAVNARYGIVIESLRHFGRVCRHMSEVYQGSIRQLRHQWYFILAAIIWRLVSFNFFVVKRAWRSQFRRCFKHWFRWWRNLRLTPFTKTSALIDSETNAKVSLESCFKFLLELLITELIRSLICSERFQSRRA